MTAYDQFGNTATSYDGNKALTFSGANIAPSGANPKVNATDIGSATTLTFASGVVTATLVLTKAETATLAAAEGSLLAAGADRLSVTVSAASAAKLAFTTQPGGGSAGQFWSTQPQVSVQDTLGNTASSTASITLAIGTNPGTGALRGTTSVAAVGGIATFSGLAMSNAGVGYTLTASSASLSSATSAAFNVAAALALPTADAIDYKSRYAAASPSTKTGAAYAAEVASLIAMEPTAGFCNKALASTGRTTNQAQCPSGSSSNSMIRLRTTFTPTPTLVGARLWVRSQGDYGRGAVALVDGTEKLFRAEINADWESWQYSSATTLTSGSKVIDWMGFEDCCDGGVSMEWSTDSVSWSPVSAAVTVTQLTLNAPADLTVGGARATYTVSRKDVGGNLASPASAQTVYLTASGSSGTFYDALTGGSVITSVVIASGQATATGYFSATTAGTYTVTASDATPANGATGLADATDEIVVTAGAASQVALTTSAAGAVSGAVFTTQPVVTIRDAQGNTVTAATTAVTLTVSAGATVVGTATVNAVAGVATFTNVGVSGTAGTAYTLTYTAGSFTATQAITPTAGAASQLTLTTGPSTEPISGTPFARQPVLQLRDAVGNVVAQAGVTVTASIASGGGTLGGTLTAMTDVNGIATFTDLVLTGAAGDRTLRFSATGLTAVTTGPIALQAGIPTATTAPALSGTALLGDTLRVSLGTWTGNPTLTVQWQRCTSDGASCVDISGATSPTLVLGETDVGTRLRAVVRASNTSGTVDSTTALSEVVRALPTMPRDVTPVAFDQAIEVRWTRPTQEGSSPITGYVLEYSTDAGETWRRAPAVSGAAQTTTRITGLINNMVYRVRVAAVSAVGTGPFATAESTVIPVAPVEAPGSTEPPNLPPGQTVVTVNGTPQTVTLRVVQDSVLELAGEDFAMRLLALDDAAKARTVDQATGTLLMEQGAQARISGFGFLPGTVVTVWLFSEPRQLGQIPVKADGTYDGFVRIPVDVPLGRHTLQANGVDRGTTERSVSLGVLLDEPADIVANAPSGVDASPLDAGAQLTWVPPVYAGGDPVRQYVVQLSRDGGTTWTDTTTVAAGDPSPTVRVMGLTNGTSYRFRIIAVNATGRSAPSAASAVVTPFKPTPLLRIAVVASTATPALGDTVTFTVTVRNEGTGEARTTVVPLPDEPRFVRVSGTASQGTVDLAAGRWSVGTVAIDGEAVLTLRVVVRKGSDPQGVR